MILFSPQTNSVPQSESGTADAEKRLKRSHFFLRRAFQNQPSYVSGVWVACTGTEEFLFHSLINPLNIGRHQIINRPTCETMSLLIDVQRITRSEAPRALFTTAAVSREL